MVSDNNVFDNSVSGYMTSGAHKPLFDRLGIEYLESNRYLPVSLGLRNVTNTLYYHRNRTEFDALATRFGGALRTGEGLPGLVVRHIGGLLGYGLFTLDPLSPGDLVGEYVGMVRRARPGRPLPGGGYSSDYSWGFPKVQTLGRSLEIDAREAGGLLRFANQPAGEAAEASAEPDHFPLGGRWRVVFVVRRALGAGEEITVDYGEAYWSGGERELIGE